MRTNVDFPLLPRNRIRNAIRFSFAGALLLPVGCSFIQIAPLDEGSYLEYRTTDYDGEASTCSLQFKDGGRNLLEIVLGDKDGNPMVTPKEGDGDDEDFSSLHTRYATLIFPDDNGKILVSRFMKRRSGMRCSLGEFGPLWLPPNILRSSKSLGFCDGFDSATVEGAGEWRGKRVVTVKASRREGAETKTWYYGEATGILVGCEITSTREEYSGSPQTALLVLDRSNIVGL
jgi:hypothetical protein